VTLRQDARNVGTQVRTHRTQGTQKIRRLRQDATPTDQTQDPFLLMWLDFERVVVAVGSEGFVRGVQGCPVGKWKGVPGAH